ncbi:GNAT family N-acetyltransferase [Actinoplanes italicus]|uniref:GNAT family N-acetyltransferase n=1 Tax=Actinoplanes italicus TaxID=113567 RepID=UPI001475435B|nr:GNAT family N-acetyltransferase [Actinoplanes italicus]
MLNHLAGLAADPSPLRREVVVDGVPLVVRGLCAEDATALTAFLAGLSCDSRRFWHGDADDTEEAAGWIEAIGRYDKLRLVAHEPGREDRLAGVVDLSFSLPEGFEITRYAAYGIELDEERTARFGPCVANEWQGRGLAAALLPPAWDAIRLFGRERVVLFGGVHAGNHRARRFYARHGFVETGEVDGTVDMMRDLP